MSNKLTLGSGINGSRARAAMKPYAAGSAPGKSTLRRCWMAGNIF